MTTNEVLNTLTKEQKDAVWDAINHLDDIHEELEDWQRTLTDAVIPILEDKPYDQFTVAVKLGWYYLAFEMNLQKWKKATTEYLKILDQVWPKTNETVNVEDLT